MKLRSEGAQRLKHVPDPHFQYLYTELIPERIFSTCIRSLYLAVFSVLVYEAYTRSYFQYRIRKHTPGRIFGTGYAIENRTVVLYGRKIH